MASGFEGEVQRTQRGPRYKTKCRSWGVEGLILYSHHRDELMFEITRKIMHVNYPKLFKVPLTKLRK